MNITKNEAASAANDPYAATRRATWLKSLAEGSIVYYVDPDADEDEEAEQHVVLEVKAEAGQAPTEQTLVILDPPYGESFSRPASALLPAHRVTVQLAIEIDVTAGAHESLDDLVKTIRGNAKAAVANGLLTTDIKGTLEDDTLITVSVIGATGILTDVQRAELVSKLTRNSKDSMQDSVDTSDKTPNASPDFDRFTDEELLREHRDIFDSAFLPDDEDEEESKDASQ